MQEEYGVNWTKGNTGVQGTGVVEEYWGTEVEQRYNVYKSSTGLQEYCRGIVVQEYYRAPGVVHWYRCTVVVQWQRVTGVTSCTGGTVLHRVHEMYRATNCSELVHVYRGTRVVTASIGVQV